MWLQKRKILEHQRTGNSYQNSYTSTNDNMQYRDDNGAYIREKAFPKLYEEEELSNITYTTTPTQQNTNKKIGKSDSKNEFFTRKFENPIFRK